MELGFIKIGKVIEVTIQNLVCLYQWRSGILQNYPAYIPTELQTKDSYPAA